jgi:D-sedoheptulose 7-phosphate isomerase
MKKDPRHRNQGFEAKSVTEYFKSYVQALQQALETLDTDTLEKAFELLVQSMRNRRRIYIAGNGGSAAIADHLCCDWTKGVYSERSSLTLKTQSLSATTALFTAIANDFSYEDSFSAQIEMLAEKNDVLVLISSSGNSPNIIKAAQTARKMGVKTIAFTGFSGGAVKDHADFHLHIGFNNYGMVEDSHQVLMHCVAQFLARLQDNT